MVVVIMGVSGSGKTTLGRLLAHALGGRFYDADDFHPEANIDKMRGGTPLTEDDRQPWLQALRREIDRWLPERDTTVLACSALTAHSRRVLGTDRPEIRLVFLDAPMHIIERRMRVRNHFMPAALVQSQFHTLERPDHALVLDATVSPDVLVQRVLEHLQED